MTTSGLQVENSFQNLGIKLSLFRDSIHTTDQTEVVCWKLNPEVFMTYYVSLDQKSKILYIVCYDNFLSVDCSDGLSDQVSQAAEFLLKTTHSLIEKKLH